MTTALKLDELASRAGVSPRTVRYYIQRGVLPAPNFKGPDTAYDERHLQALRAIKRLQEEYLPLDAIASTLEGKTTGELRKIADRGLPAETGTSAAGSSAGLRPPPPRSVTTTRGERIALARGVELWVGDDADRALVEAILSLTQKRGHS